MLRKFEINGKIFELDPKIPLIKACELVGVEIPRFCYHESLSVAGNCRMCLVDVVGEPKLVASCSRRLSDLRPGPNGEPTKIVTDSVKVRKGRQGVMEFLLINHPLDCPICDQGGECDLQDQAMVYGVDQNRFGENKRAIEDKYLGELIKTSMTRCIHCTRCVRFLAEIAGNNELGTFGRGEDLEIISMLESGLTSELQGNLADICPVGALTHKQSALKARPWELSHVYGVDFSDALGSNVQFDTLRDQIQRILPVRNDQINKEWLSDKARYLVDGIKSQRLDRCYAKNNQNIMQEISTKDALSQVAKLMENTPPSEQAILAGNLMSLEEMIALNSFAKAAKINNKDCRDSNACYNLTLGGASVAFANYQNIGKADAILLIGCFPRYESILCNSEIYKAYQAGLEHIAVIGAVDNQIDYSYPVKNLGCDVAALRDLLDGKGQFYQILKNAKSPLIILGEGALAGSSSAASSLTYKLSLSLAIDVGAIVFDDEQQNNLEQSSQTQNSQTQNSQENKTNWQGFALLHHAASRLNGLYADLLPDSQENASALDTASIIQGVKNGKVKLLFLVAEDEKIAELASYLSKKTVGNLSPNANSSQNSPKIVYFGSHGDRGANMADIIIPIPAYCESEGTSINLSGHVQRFNAAVPPLVSQSKFYPDLVCHLLQCLSFIAELNGYDYSISSVEEARDFMSENYPELSCHRLKLSYNKSAISDFLANLSVKKVDTTESEVENETVDAVIKAALDNFFYTNPIVRASKVLAKAGEAQRRYFKLNKEGTNPILDAEILPDASSLSANLSGD